MTHCQYGLPTRTASIPSETITVEELLPLDVPAEELPEDAAPTEAAAEPVIQSVKRISGRQAQPL